MPNHAINRDNLQLFRQICFAAIVALLITPAVVQSTTQITGTVTMKRADSVKIEFKPHKTASPKNGDQVDFKTIIRGLEVNAGQGEVTESESGFVWAKITKGRPNLKMSGIIHATGKPSTVSVGQRDRAAESEQIPLNKPRQAQVFTGESLSKQDLEKAIILELIRLRYMSKKTDENVPADALQTAIDMCGLERGFSSGRKINGELLNFLRKLDPR